MPEANKEIDLPWWQKALALAIVCAVILLIFLVPGWLGFKGDASDTPDFRGCDTLRNPTPCPEPDYDESIENLKKEPY